MKISIIVPVYNSAKYLEKTVESILKQRYENFYLYLVDDGSTDLSGEICERFATKDARIKVIHRENGGVSQARNTALEFISDTDYFFFIDADDSIGEYYLLNNVQILKKYNPDILFTSFIKDFGTDQLVDKIYKDDFKVFNGREQLRRLIGERNKELRHPIQLEELNPVCGKFYRTKKFSQLRFIPSITRSEDLIFNLEAFLIATNCIYNGKDFYYYNRKNDTSAVSSYDPDLVTKIKNVDSIINNFIIDNNLGKEYKEAFFNRRALELITISINYSKAPIKNNRLKGILLSSYYQTAIKKLDVKNLDIKFKLFFYLCKKGAAIPIILVVSLLMKNRKRVKR